MKIMLRKANIGLTCSTKTMMLILSCNENKIYTFTFELLTKSLESGREFKTKNTAVTIPKNKVQFAHLDLTPFIHSS